MEVIQYQKTVRKSFTIKGAGLHTALPVTVTVKPAPPHTGVIFKRMSRTATESAAALIDNIIPPEKTGGRQTNLICGSHKIQTIEHLLSTFHAFGIDNAIVELDSDELPALDGSALPYAQELANVGTEDQKTARDFLIITEPIYLETESTSTVILPHPTLRISYTLSYHDPALADQFVSFTIDENTFLNELAPARTFCLKNEADMLQARGFGKGATCKNTLVFDHNEPVDNTLRFPDEAARHKVVDLLGDLYLLGRPIKGHIITYKTGHVHNIELVKKLRTVQPRAQTVREAVCVEELRQATQLDINQIMQILPHRYPFLFVDKVVELVPGKRAVGIKNISYNEQVFQGHFPGHPIFPGVLIIEAMAQTGGIVTMLKEVGQDKVAYFMSIDKVKFRAPVFPGDQMRMEVDVIKSKGPIGVCACKVYVGNKLVCEGEIKFTTMDR